MQGFHLHSPVHLPDWLCTPGRLVALKVAWAMLLTTTAVVALQWLAGQAEKLVSAQQLLSSAEYLHQPCTFCRCLHSIDLRATGTGQGKSRPHSFYLLLDTAATSAKCARSAQADEGKGGGKTSGHPRARASGCTSGPCASQQATQTQTFEQSLDQLVKNAQADEEKEGKDTSSATRQGIRLTFLALCKPLQLYAIIQGLLHSCSLLADYLDHIPHHRSHHPVSAPGAASL